MIDELVKSTFPKGTFVEIIKPISGLWPRIGEVMVVTGFSTYSCPNYRELAKGELCLHVTDDSGYTTSVSSNQIRKVLNETR